MFDKNIKFLCYLYFKLQNEQSLKRGEIKICKSVFTISCKASLIAIINH